MTENKYQLERTVVICAERSTVFRYFTDSERFADWWGAGSTIEGKPGGSLQICFPGGVKASGQVLEIVTGERIVFTYGFDSGKPIPPGASLVTVVLKDHSEGTQLTLHHEFADQAARDEHIQGWRYQLALFANVASREQHSRVHSRVDDYFAMWNMMDSNARRNAMDGLLHPDIKFQDAYSCTHDLDDLNAHISAGKQFMPGLSIRREGDVHQCQGTVISRWVASKADGTETGRGLNVFSLCADGRIQRIVGFWLPA